ncbi:hypothetical protein [Spiroplasma endosymbiont of Zeiraphera isertana]|uniref:hypothetical protein n=1 Tax=Spiroplasma endosymbiont of Zeiraphera isertana TaxID=3066313 RepID=UPI00313B662D
MYFLIQLLINIFYGIFIIVTVNISALWVEREFGFQNNLIKSHADKDIKEFILNSNADKNFDKQSLFVKLGMFWKLDQAFVNQK